MKRFAIILAVFALPALMIAQNSAVDKLFNKYKGKEGITTVSISPELFQVIDAMGMEEIEDAEIPFDKVGSVQILTIEDTDAYPDVNFYEEIEKDLNTEDYAEVMTVNDGSEVVRMWMKAEANKVLEFLLIVGGDDNVLIYITGDFDMDDLEELAETFGDDLDIDL